MSRPRVEFLWWEQCPSWERALEELRAAMSDAGADPGAIELRRVGSERDAERERFPGSPTIRIDGEDPDPPGAGQPTGLLCRVYRRDDGRASPLPDPDKVRAALGRALVS